MRVFFLVMSASLFAFWFFALVFYLLDLAVFSKKRRIRSVVSSHKIEMYAELEKSFFDRFLAPALRQFSTILVHLIPEKSAVDAAKVNTKEQFRKQLRFAGISLTVEEFNSIKTIYILAVLLATIIVFLRMGVANMVSYLLLLVGIILSILGPRYFLTSRITARTRQINIQLPEVMDLLSVSIEAGLGFDSALVKISETISGPLVDELIVLNREIQMGLPRRTALKNFGDCCDLKELKVFASSLAQAEQLGIPIKNVLTTQSAQIRTTRRQKAQEKGLKAPVKIMLPMVAFVFPVMFIILLGPTVINLIKQFG